MASLNKNKKRLRDKRVHSVLKMTTNYPMTCRELYVALASTNKRCGVLSVHSMAKILPRFDLLSQQIYRISKRFGVIHREFITVYQMSEENERPDEVITNEGEMQDMPDSDSQQPIPESQLREL